MSLFCQKWELHYANPGGSHVSLSPTSQSSCLHKEQVKTNYCYNWSIRRDTNPLLLELSSPHFARAKVRNLPSPLSSQDARGTDRSPKAHPKGIQKNQRRSGAIIFPSPPAWRAIRLCSSKPASQPQGTVQFPLHSVGLQTPQLVFKKVWPPS